MRKRHALPALFLAGLIAGATLLGADSRGRQANRSAAQPADSIVTPVVGPSWLNHLKLNFSDSSLGRGAGRYGPTGNRAPDGDARLDLLRRRPIKRDHRG